MITTELRMPSGGFGYTGRRCPVIIGAHAILYTRDAGAARAFFRDTLGLRSVDAGGGWLIFALPPAELAAHPAETGDTDLHRLYLVCDDLSRTVRDLKRRGVRFVGRVSRQPWGALIIMRVPGGATLGLYEPRHPMAIRVRRPRRKARGKPRT